MTENKPKIIFADDHARLSYEIQNDVQRELARLQLLRGSDLDSEGNIQLTPISFGTENDEKGEAALFYLGDFENAEDPDIDDEGWPIVDPKGPITYFVRPTTLQVLDALQIPYTNLEAKQPE